MIDGNYNNNILYTWLILFAFIPEAHLIIIGVYTTSYYLYIFCSGLSHLDISLPLLQ